MKDRELAKSITRLASGYGIVSDLPKEKPVDSINPEHYKSGDIECIDAIKSSLDKQQFKGYLKASVIKYLWRYEKKNGLDDLQKANWFLQRLIKEEDNGSTDMDFYHS